MVFKSKQLNLIFYKKIWFKEVIRMVFIMKKNYNGFLQELHPYYFIKELKSDCLFPAFVKEMNSLNYSLLYKSRIHGFSHIERVCILTYILARLEAFSEKDLKRILFMAKYHDIGRSNDFESPNHGKLGADRLASMNSGLSEEDNKLIRAVIHAHSLDDAVSYSIYKMYKIKEYSYFDFLKYLLIIKDADALDRFRLSSTSLNVCFLRKVYSKRLISLACLLSLAQKNHK